MSPVVLWIGGAMLAIAALLIVYRIERGPAMLDRSIALDMLVGALVASLALISAATGRTDLLNVMMVLALVGFVGSVTLARFVALESESEGRIITEDQADADNERVRERLARERSKRVPGRDAAMRRAAPESEEER